MKILKKIGIIICVLFLSGCSLKKESVEKPKEEKKPEIIEEVYQDNNPVKVGLYNYTGNKYVLYKEYNSNIKSRTDINTFQIVFSDDAEVTYTGNRYDFIKSSWDEIKDKCKLGIMLEYDTLNEGHIKHVIYNPDNILEHDHYIQIYLYDAIAHRNDKWYSHITKEEFNENTYITSFKLYAHDKIDEVIFPVKLSVFTYDSDDDFDENNNYRGNSIYTIEINKK